MTQDWTVVRRMIGTSLALLGAILLVWAIMAVYDAALGLPFSVPLADGTIPGHLILGAGFLGVLLISAGANLPMGGRRPRIVLTGGPARVGRPLEGRLVLARRVVEPRTLYRLALSCSRVGRSGSGERGDAGTTCHLEQDAEVFNGPDGWSVPFRFEPPATAPASAGRDPVGRQGYEWKLRFFPARGWIAVVSSLGFPVGDWIPVQTSVTLSVGPAPKEELRFVPATESPDQAERIDTIGRQLGRALGSRDRAQLRNLSPRDLELAGKVAEMPAKILATALKVLLVLAVLPVIVFAVLAAVNAIVNR